MMRLWLLHRLIGTSLLLVFAADVVAQPRTVVLPDYLCGGTDSIFADGFETAGLYTSDASGGTGGVWPGKSTETFYGSNFGTQTYYVYVPPAYDPASPMPLMVVLHGAAGSHSQAFAAAKAARDKWVPAANAYGFIIAAPVGNGNSGAWVTPADYTLTQWMIDDVAELWNIERNRISGWGFSAGGHVAWDMLLNAADYPLVPFTVSRLASMAISGANSQFACYNNAATCGGRFASLSRKIPVALYIGTSDPNYGWAAGDYQRLLNNGWVQGRSLDYHAFAGGHNYTQLQLKQIAGFACGFAVQP